MKHWKTSFSGIFAIATLVLSSFGIDLPGLSQKVLGQLATGAAGVGLVLAADKKPE